MSVDLFTAFIMTATVLTMAPGLDTAMVLRSAGSGGVRSGVASAVGIAFGCLCWGIVTAAGLASLMHAFPLAFTVLRWSGALYLGWLGLQLIVHTRQTAPIEQVVNGDTARVAMHRGFLTNILNPKVGLFYITLLPQFVTDRSDAGPQTFVLAISHVGIVFAWFTLLSVAASGVRPLLRRPAVTTTLDRLTGGLFIVLGLQMVILARPPA